MDSNRFDEFTKRLATPTSRRQALKAFAASVMGGIFGLSEADPAEAAGKCLGLGSKCAHGDQCCSATCTNNRCACPSGQITCNGNCCASGQSCCSGACVNLSSDPNNCGSCGHVCTAPANASAVCSGGACTFVCNSGYTSCAGSCVNEQTDAKNCGNCGHVCAAGEMCVNGACTCGSSGVKCVSTEPVPAAVVGIVQQA